MQIRKAGGAAGPDRQKRDKAAARRKALKNRGDEEKAKLFQEIMARIRMVTETRTQVELADFLGIRQSSVSDSCRRQAVPPQWYLTLLAKLGVNPRWLETGLGQQYILGPRSGEAEADGAEPQGDGPPERGFCRLVRVHSSRCLPPGPGRVPVLPVLGEMALPCEWLQPSLVLLHLESNAGQPHFPRGAYVGVDTACVQPLPGEYYAVFLPAGGVGVVSLRVAGEGVYAAAPDEGRGESPEDGGLECPAAHILGRALWVWRPF